MVKRSEASHVLPLFSGLRDLWFPQMCYRKLLTIFLHPLGRVIVAYAGAKPNDADLKTLTDAVNKLIAENKPVQVSEMNRKEAEATYTKSPVNGQFIYEKKEPPATVESLTIVTIPDCTVSVSASTEFVESTKLVGGVEIVKFNHRENKQELEVVYNLLSDAPTPKEIKAKKVAAAAAAPIAVVKAETVPEVTAALLDVFVESINKLRPDAQLTAAEIETLRRSTALKSSVLLTALKNSAYGSGYAAHISK